MNKNYNTEDPVPVHKPNPERDAESTAGRWF